MPDQARQCGPRQRSELHLAQEGAAGSERALEGVGGAAARERAARENEQHGKVAQPPRDVAGELEAGGIRHVDVLHQQDDRLAPRHPLDELDDSLVEAHALEIGRRRGPGRAIGPRRRSSDGATGAKSDGQAAS